MHAQDKKVHTEKQTCSYINTALGPNMLENGLLMNWHQTCTGPVKAPSRMRYLIRGKELFAIKFDEDSLTGGPLKSQGHSFSPSKRNLFKGRHEFQILYSILNFINKNFIKMSFSNYLYLYIYILLTHYRKCHWSSIQIILEKRISTLSISDMLLHVFKRPI